MRKGPLRYTGGVMGRVFRALLLVGPGLAAAYYFFVYLVVWSFVVVYAALGSLFMPFLAGTLFFLMNRREWMGGLRNGRLANAGLAVSLLLFLCLAVAGLLERFGS
ncbi:MAG: hypothetical protein ABIK65_12305 [Candidatus Eisenbacteria bacterium]